MITVCSLNSLDVNHSRSSRNRLGAKHDINVCIYKVIDSTKKIDVDNVAPNSFYGESLFSNTTVTLLAIKRHSTMRGVVEQQSLSYACLAEENNECTLLKN